MVDNRRRDAVKKLIAILLSLAIAFPVYGNSGAAGAAAANRRRTGGGGTTLDSFSNLIAWYKSPIAGATNGNPISSWPDSKSSYNLTGAAAPNYVTSSINGYASTSWSFNYLDNGGSDSSTFPYTLVAVVNLTDTTNYRYILGSTPFTGGLVWRTNITTGYMELDDEFVSAIGVGNVAVPTGSWHVLAAVVTSSTWALWIDGVTAGSGSHSVSLSTGKSFIMGASVFGPHGFPWLGNMVEIGIYSSDHTSDIAAITSSLNLKYGL